MKKFSKALISLLVLTLSLCMLLSLAGCGSKEESSTVSDETPVADEVAVEDVTEAPAQEAAVEVVEDVASPIDTPVPTADSDGLITYTSVTKNFTFKFDQQYIALANQADNAIIYAGGDTEIPFCSVSIISNSDATEYLTQMAADSKEELGKNLKTEAGAPQNIDYGDRDICYIYYIYKDSELDSNVICAYYAENLDDGSIVVYNSTAIEGDTEAVDSILKTAIETFSMN